MNNDSILIVDDGPQVRSRLSRLFHNEGYDTFLAENGAEALEIMERGSVSIILSDFSLQGTTGVELLETVQEKYPEVVRIILSSEDGMNAVMTGIQKGVVSHFLLKPWDDIVLKETVQNAIKKAEQKKQLREKHIRINRWDGIQELDLRNMEILDIHETTSGAIYIEDTLS